MPDNPYEAPQEGTKRKRQQWPSVEFVLLYIVGIPLVALLIGFGLLAWSALQMTD
jgi:hypothetical protein